MKFTSIFLISLILVSLVFVTGCSDKCSQAEPVTVTPISFEKNQGLPYTQYHVTYEITNKGKETEKNLMVIFTMNSGNSWDFKKNESEPIEQLNASETKRMLIDFSSVLFSLDEKNFYGTPYKTANFCSVPS